MFDNNFWYWILKGLGDFLVDFSVNLPLAAGWGLVNNVSAILYFAVVPFLLWIGTFMDLRVFALVVGIILTGEIARAAIAAWRWVLTVIPFAG